MLWNLIQQRFGSELAWAEMGWTLKLKISDEGDPKLADLD